jgi:hypothetical protein
MSSIGGTKALCSSDSTLAAKKTIEHPPVPLNSEKTIGISAL